MFLNEADLDDVEEIRVTSKFVRPATASSMQPRNDMTLRLDDEEPELPAFRSAGTLGTPSSSRARTLAQQRELQLKKRQAAVQSGGMMRSSIESAAAPSPAASRDGGQFTPALRQFSQPKSLRESEGSSEFTRPRDEGKPSARTIVARYSDDEDEDDRRPSQRRQDTYQQNSNNYSRHRDSPPRNNFVSNNNNVSNNNMAQAYQNDTRGPPVSDNYRSNDGYRNDNYRDDRNDRGDYRDDRYGGGRGGPPPSQVGRSRQDDDYMRSGYSNNQSFDDGYRGGAGRGDDRYQYDNNRDDGGYSATPQRNDRDARPQGYGNLTPSAAVNYGGPNTPNYGNGANSNSAVSSPSRPLYTSPDLSNMRRFLTTPLSKSCGVVQCYIRRNKSGTHKLFPIYSLYLKEGDVFLMASKKRPKNKTSNYLISSDQNNLNRGGPHYLGKLRSNFVGTEFQVFDDGVNPKDGEADEGPAGGNTQVRCELGGVMYAANVLGSRGPRKMQVALPGLDETHSIVKWRDGQGPSQSGYSNPNPNPNQPDDMLSRIRDRNLRDLVYLINKPPRWNEQVGAYVLNFNGRVTMASVKNFQLVDPEEQNSVVLQFGRVGKDEFTMDMQYPISPFQAFAVTLSSFDSKIACD